MKWQPSLAWQHFLSEAIGKTIEELTQIVQDDVYTLGPKQRVKRQG